MLGAQASLTSAATGPGVILASLSLVLLAMGLAWWLGLRIERRLIEASLRAAVQLFAVGFIFLFIFTAAAAIYWAWLWVGVMVVVATIVWRFSYWSCIWCWAPRRYALSPPSLP